MLFALMAWDKEGALSVRMQNRPDHLTYLENSNLVRQAGPFIDKGGEPCGSLIILETYSMAAYGFGLIILNGRHGHDHGHES